MAKFVFKMQNILELRQKLEEQQKTAFRNANAALITEQEQLKELIVRQAEYERKFKESQMASINIKDINFYKRAIDIMKSKVRDQMFVVNKAQKALEQERIKLNEAIKDRKIQEKLKEHAFEDFKKEIAEQENKEIDQLISFTHKA